MPTSLMGIVANPGRYLGPFWPLFRVFFGRRPEPGRNPDCTDIRVAGPAGAGQGRPGGPQERAQKGPFFGPLWGPWARPGGPGPKTEGENEGPLRGRAGGPEKGPFWGPKGPKMALK